MGTMGRYLLGVMRNNVAIPWMTKEGGKVHPSLSILAFHLEVGLVPRAPQIHKFLKSCKYVVLFTVVVKHRRNLFLKLLVARQTAAKNPEHAARFVSSRLVIVIRVIVIAFWLRLGASLCHFDGRSLIVHSCLLAFIRIAKCRPRFFPP